MVFQSGCRLGEEAQVWVPAFSHLFAARIKKRKNHKWGWKISAALRTQSTCVWFSSKALQRGAHLLPAHPSLCHGVLPVSSAGAALRGNPSWKKCVFNLWVVLQSLKWLHSNHRGCEMWHRAACQRLRGARAVQSAGQSPAVGLCWESSPEWWLPKGCLPSWGGRNVPVQRLLTVLCFTLVTGTVMTPNYIDSSSLSVAPWCDCSNSGNDIDECLKFLNFFQDNICLSEYKTKCLSVCCSMFSGIPLLLERVTRHRGHGFVLCWAWFCCRC